MSFKSHKNLELIGSSFDSDMTNSSNTNIIKPKPAIRKGFSLTSLSNFGSPRSNGPKSGSDTSKKGRMLSVSNLTSIFRKSDKSILDRVSDSIKHQNAYSINSMFKQSHGSKKIGNLGFRRQASNNNTSTRGDNQPHISTPPSARTSPKLRTISSFFPKNNGPYPPRSQSIDTCVDDLVVEGVKSRGSTLNTNGPSIYELNKANAINRIKHSINTYTDREVKVSPIKRQLSKQRLDESESMLDCMVNQQAADKFQKGDCLSNNHPTVFSHMPPAAEKNTPSDTVFDSSGQDSHHVYAQQQLQKPLPSIPVEKKPKDTDENDRFKRQRDITGIMTGKKSLSPEFNEKYIIGDLLGDGAFGFVISAMRKIDKLEVAVKFIAKSKINRDLWVRFSDEDDEIVPLEVSLLNKFRHPNIIRYIEHINASDYILLVTELHGTSWNLNNPEINPKRNQGLKSLERTKSVDGTNPNGTALVTIDQGVRKRTSCDLFECIDAHVKIPERAAKKIFAQIASVVHFLHQNGYVHRDLKDENIVIDADYWIKLIDFGSASKIPKHPSDYFMKFNGTAHFASPEIANGSSYRGPEAEVWALGVLLYTIVFGENPFQNRAEIIKGYYHYPHKISSSLKDLIEKLLCYDINKRSGMDEILQHPWIADEIEQLKRQNYK